MDKWPQELYDRVIFFCLKRIHASNPAFLALATVSRKFQNSVESHSFRRLLITATESKLNELERILTPRRRNFLRQLSLKMTLPPYSSKYFTEFETDQDRRANNEVITAALKRVFYLISTLYGQDADMEPILVLNILGASSPSDKGVRLFLPKVPADYRYQVRLDLNEQRYNFSLLDLTSDVSDFPLLPCVREFTISDGRRNWSPRVAMLLSTKMTKAESISWHLDRREDSWGRYYSMDRTYRDELVKSITSADLPSSTKKFLCHIVPPWTENRQKLLSQFIAPGDQDPVSRALQHLTRSCLTVHIIAPIHHTFYNSLADMEDDVGQWKNVKTLKATVYMQNPSGKWLFKLGNGFIEDQDSLITLDHLPPGYGNTNEELEEREKFYYQHMVQPGRRDDPERVIPDDIELNSLFTAFARACCRLPVLREAPVEVGCLAPGTPFPRGKQMHSHNKNSWRVYFYLHQWRPSETTIEELKMIGRIRDGCDPVFLWGE
ncbi:uncharacterized protein F4812DRAFT_470234 [Daldinia caldariorum]|uniref:uncharacterized protein n=1 Tax=Daldinia caldariorum TaxID=326644 RepID=UPI002008ADBA|nr:uncharacterized protein F4812DRAFT_470234 [Daldinia caldariorum]KAI1469107.1 hypothetical protein F4812DRAFT_470234 [Daldinia caldariorum]